MYITPSGTGHSALSDNLVSLGVITSKVLTIWLLLVFGYHVFIKNQIKQNLITAYFIMTMLYYFITTETTLNEVLLVLKTQVTATTLQNGLANIHPYIILYSYVIIVCIWNLLYTCTSIAVNKMMFLTNILNIIIVVCLGIILGAIWANQELNWGGFWSWDPVELISLLLLFFLLRLLHSPKSQVNSTTSMSIYFVIYILVIMVIRLGVISTIHAFIRSVNTPIIVYWYFFISGILLISFTVNLMSMWRNDFVPIRAGAFLPRILNFFFLLCVALIISIIYELVFLPYSKYIAYVFFNPSTQYSGLIIIICLVYCLIYSPRVSINNILVLLFLNCSVYFYNIPLFCIVISLLALVKFNQATTHTNLLLCYLVFYFLFIPYPVASELDEYSAMNFSTSDGVFSHGFDNQSETFFFMKKSSILINVKNNITHVSGFLIPTNFFCALFMFSKGFKATYIFGEDLLFMCVIYICYLTSLHFYNYKIITHALKF